MRRLLLLAFLGPSWLFFFVMWWTTTAPLMAVVNVLVGGEGGFWRYMREVQREISADMIQVAKNAWQGTLA